MKNITPREYLMRVLGQWPEFCRGHRRFEKAIKDLLTENEMLRTELDRLRGKLNDN